MAQEKEALMEFIKEHRSNEANFEKLLARLQDEGTGSVISNKEEILEKGKMYKEMKESTGSAWPEFEKFVTAFEVGVTGK